MSLLGSRVLGVAEGTEVRWAEVWLLLAYCLWKFSVPSDTVTSAGTGVKDLGRSVLRDSQDCSPIRWWPAFSVFILGPGTGQSTQVKL